MRDDPVKSVSLDSNSYLNTDNFLSFDFFLIHPW